MRRFVAINTAMGENEGAGTVAGHTRHALKWVHMQNMYITPLPQTNAALSAQRVIRGETVCAEVQSLCAGPAAFIGNETKPQASARASCL